MAASWKIGGGLVRNVVGKRLQLPTPSICCSPSPTATLLIPSSSSSYSSTSQDIISAAYQKNPDDQAPQSVVPDELIQPVSEEYWAPDPQTGVFTPPSDHNGLVSADHAEGEAHSSSTAEGSVLEEEAFFRPTGIEDLEKPVTVPDLEEEQEVNE